MRGGGGSGVNEGRRERGDSRRKRRRGGKDRCPREKGGEVWWRGKEDGWKKWVELLSLRKKFLAWNTIIPFDLLMHTFTSITKVISDAGVTS